MAQFRNPAYPDEAGDKAASDVVSIRANSRSNLDWVRIIQLRDRHPAKADHGPTSSDAFQAWAMPEHLREDS